MDPRAEPLDLPRGYGTASTPLAWPEVRARLVEARAYWIATSRADGRPHVVPVDGLWLDDRLWYGGGEDAVHVRTARRDPRVVVHLPDPHRVVIVDGRAEAPDLDRSTADRLAAAAAAKYPEYGRPDPDSYAGALAVRPRRVLAWTAFPGDATRFVFGG